MNAYKSARERDLLLKLGLVLLWPLLTDEHSPPHRPEIAQNSPEGDKLKQANYELSGDEFMLHRHDQRPYSR